MSNNLSSVAMQEFDSMVKHAYQGAGQLRDAVTVRNGVVGDTYKFRKMGKGLALEKAVSSEVVQPMNVAHSLINCSLSNFYASEYTDLFDAAEVNFDEKNELASTIAGALGRKQDQLIIDALNAASGTGTVDDGNGGLGVEEVTAAKKTLVANSVGTGNLQAVIDADGLADLLGDEKATSGDYQNIKALVSGDIDTFMGFKIHVIGTRAEGGLPLASNTITSFFFDRDAVGLAVGIDMKTTVDYIPERVSHLCTGMLKAGAVVRDAEGVVKVTYDVS